MADGGLDVVTVATGDPLGIVELVDVCERAAARNQTLFERIGGWVADEPDPVLQRWFAVAAHRHAWHAELWLGRRPTIPIDAPLTERADERDAEDRVGWYRSELAAVRSELVDLAGRVDAELDPGTQRVIDLVLADLDDLADLADLGGPDTGQGRTTSDDA